MGTLRKPGHFRLHNQIFLGHQWLLLKTQSSTFISTTNHFGGPKNINFRGPVSAPHRSQSLHFRNTKEDIVNLKGHFSIHNQELFKTPMINFIDTKGFFSGELGTL